MFNYPRGFVQLPSGISRKWLLQTVLSSCSHFFLFFLQRPVTLVTVTLGRGGGGEFGQGNRGYPFWDKKTLPFPNHSVVPGPGTREPGPGPGGTKNQKDARRNSVQNHVLASPPSFFLSPFAKKTLFPQIILWCPVLLKTCVVNQRSVPCCVFGVPCCEIPVPCCVFGVSCCESAVRAVL